MREEILFYLRNLRDQIVRAFEQVEGAKKFERTNWNYEKGTGGGEMSVLRGSVFEKAAVNWSGVGGDKFPAGDSTGPFFATGVSVITHMANPNAPTVHMNVRYIETANKCWFGGGYDLTPMGIGYNEDKNHFHNTAKLALEKFGADLYPKFSANAKEYFFIKHRNKERGVGGIFFDHFNSGDQFKDFQMMRAVGDSFLPAILPIYERRVQAKYSDEDRTRQLKTRAHYVEFNLLYDRGTKFGFESGGNPDAILCSMPPLVSW